MLINVLINEEGLNSIKIFNSQRKAHCIFEFIYFARPDSYIFGHVCINTIRKELGRHLAKKHAVDVDLVIPVPDSGMPAALGYAEENRIPF